MYVTLHTLLIILGLIVAAMLWKSKRKQSLLVILAMILFVLSFIVWLFPSLNRMINFNYDFTNFLGILALYGALLVKK